MSRPLVLNTRPAHQAADLSAALRARGCDVLEAPATRVVPGWDAAAVAATRARLAAGAYDWVVLPSANAARCLVAALDGAAEAAGLLGRGHVRVLCGPATAGAVVSLGLTADHVRVLDPFSAVAALAVLADEPGLRRVLLPGAREGRDELADGLRVRNVPVDALVVYETVPAEPATLRPAADALRAGAVAAVAFASPSAVRNLLAGLAALGEDGPELLAAPALAAIGATTATAIADASFHPSVVAERTTADALAEAVVRVVPVGVHA